ncbi:hypothetical protein [Bifidobacterium scardovii]|uniref:hypothetical protein n=1 Tax=Bifidobacterium scardovii TaxID=158787 RepID=UPI00242D848B|nr:hypothetical protein [Bifidobacterium scardovii]MBS6947388.1 hypothetical protein [Bifidobacterium scardovii]
MTNDNTNPDTVPSTSATDSGQPSTPDTAQRDPDNEQTATVSGTDNGSAGNGAPTDAGSSSGTGAGNAQDSAAPGGANRPAWDWQRADSPDSDIRQDTIPQSAAGSDAPTAGSQPGQRPAQTTGQPGYAAQPGFQGYGQPGYGQPNGATQPGYAPGYMAGYAAQPNYGGPQAYGAQPAWPQPAPNAGASGQTGTLGRIGAQSLGQLTKKTWAILVGVALVCGLVGGAIGAAGFSALDGDSGYRVQQMQMPGGMGESNGNGMGEPPSGNGQSGNSGSNGSADSGTGSSSYSDGSTSDLIES